MKSRAVFILYSVLFLFVTAHLARAWEVDFSRRQKRNVASETSLPEKKPATSTRLDDLVRRVKGDAVYDRQEVVILNTAKGFVPSNVRLHKGVHYLVHVVNVNEDKKNVSYMLDAFGQHHATYFGKIKSFNLDPDQEGVYEFQCPETSAEGKIVVFGNTAPPVATELPPKRNITSEH